MRLLFVFFLITICLLPAAGQSYQSALGLRVGTDIGFTYQQRIAKYQTIEGILQTALFRRSGQFAAVWEFHNALISRGFNFYYGVGPQFGWIEDRNDQYSYGTGGVTGIVGAEMTLGKIVLSFDIKPDLNFIGVNNSPARPLNIGSALSVRTVIVKKGRFGKRKKSKNKSWNPFKKKKHKI